MKKFPIILKHIPKSGGTFLFEKISETFNFINLCYPMDNKILKEKSFGEIASPFICKYGKNEPHVQTKLEQDIIHKYGRDDCMEFKIQSNKNVTNIYDIELMRAHFMFDYLKKSDDYYLISIIRNPIDMFYSEYYHHRNLTHSITIDNAINNLDNWRLGYIKNVIETCDFVGVSEYMGETLNYLNKEFNLSMVNENKSNVNPLSEKEIKYNYRRAEVTEKCSEVLDVYNNYIKEFKKKL